MPDGPMKLSSVIIVLLAKLHEVLAGLGDEVAVQLQVQVSVIGDQPHVTLLLHSGIPGSQKSENRQVSDMKYSKSNEEPYLIDGDTMPVKKIDRFNQG